VKSDLILSKGTGITCHGDSIATYLESLSMGCLEAAAAPSPKMLEVIAGLLRIAARTLAELKPNETKVPET
jgi:hypothetical protein